MRIIAPAISLIFIFTLFTSEAYGSPFEGNHIGDIGGNLISVYSSELNELGPPTHDIFSGTSYRHDLYSWSALMSGDKDFTFGVDFKGHSVNEWSYITVFAAINLTDGSTQGNSIVTPLSGKIIYSSNSIAAYTHIAGLDVPLYSPEKIIINVTLKDLVPAIYVPCDIGSTQCKKDQVFKDFGRIDLYLGITTLTPAPEPQTIALCIAGMAVVLFKTRRNKAHKTMLMTLPDNV